MCLTGESCCCMAWMGELTRPIGGSSSGGGRGGGGRLSRLALPERLPMGESSFACSTPGGMGGASVGRIPPTDDGPRFTTDLLVGVPTGDRACAALYSAWRLTPGVYGGGEGWCSYGGGGWYCGTAPIVGPLLVRCCLIYCSSGTLPASEAAYWFSSRLLGRAWPSYGLVLVGLLSSCTNSFPRRYFCMSSRRDFASRICCGGRFFGRCNHNTETYMAQTSSGNSNI